MNAFRSRPSETAWELAGRPRAALRFNGPLTWGYNLMTRYNWNITLQGNFDRDTQGDQFKLVAGNKAEYVKGFKSVLVVANINEIVLGGKNEEILGLETKFVWPRLSETFVGAKNSGTIAVTFESNSADKHKLSPSGSSRAQTDTKAMCPDVQDLLGKVEEKYASLLLRGSGLTQKLTELYMTAIDIRTKADELHATIDTYSGKFGDVLWKGGVWTEACEGAYEIEAGAWEALPSGACEIKGSEVKFTYWGGSQAIECAGGKVKIGRNLTVE